MYELHNKFTTLQTIKIGVKTGKTNTRQLVSVIYSKGWVNNCFARIFQSSHLEYQSYQLYQSYRLQWSMHRLLCSRYLFSQWRIHSCLRCPLKDPMCRLNSCSSNRWAVTRVANARRAKSSEITCIFMMFSVDFEEAFVWSTFTLFQSKQCMCLCFGCLTLPEVCFLYFCSRGLSKRVWSAGLNKTGKWLQHSLYIRIVSLDDDPTPSLLFQGQENMFSFTLSQHLPVTLWVEGKMIPFGRLLSKIS